MKVIQDIQQWQQIRKDISPNVTIGFVPTMGCLHIGHASLINKSVAENNITVLSIFVNPTQFNDANDFQHYPKTLENDLALAEELKVDYVLMPNAEDIYPGGNLIHLQTEHPLAKMFEGQFRPGHFNGVLTVVMKLLQLAQPTKIYMGEKDYQQYYLVKEMINNYFLTSSCELCPTVREESGLPYSSRNTRLSTEQRTIVEQFYRYFYQNKIFDVEKIKIKLTKLKLTFDYVEEYENRLFLAFRIDPIRIIDNVFRSYSAI